MLVVCPACQGTVVDSQARFCNHCGCQLDAEPLAATTIPDLQRNDVLAEPPSLSPAMIEVAQPPTTLDAAQTPELGDVLSTLPPWFKAGDQAPPTLRDPIRAELLQPEVAPASTSDRELLERASSSRPTQPDTLPAQASSDGKASARADLPTEPLDRYQGPIPSFLRETLAAPAMPKPPPTAARVRATEDAQAIFAPLDNEPAAAAAPAEALRFELERPMLMANAATEESGPDVSLVPKTPFSAAALPSEQAAAPIFEGAIAPPPALPLYSPHVAGRLRRREPALAVDHAALLAAAEPTPEMATAGAGRWLMLLVKLVVLVVATGATYLLLPAYRAPGAAAVGVVLLLILLGSRRRTAAGRLE